MKTTFKRLHYRLDNERGAMLLITYFVIAILVGLSATTFKLTTNEGRLSERQRLTSVAFHIAEAGIERALYDLRQDVINSVNPDWSDCSINGMTPTGSCGTPGVYYDIPYGAVSFNDGVYEVELKNQAIGVGEDVWVRSVGIINDVSHTIEVYVRMVNISPWGNAIFAGGGASGNVVNGNVDIRGSVHILGDNLNPGDNAVDLGGTAEFVGNNYNGLDPALEALVPPLPTTSVNGETVETLNAELRVKKGIVGLSGSSTVGETDSFGNGEKEQVDGTYVTDGWNGTKGDASVYSDNGTTNGYDLGNAVNFPDLGNSYQGYADYRTYLGSLGAHVADAADMANLANITPTSNFTVGNCASNCISVDGAGNMTVKGIVVVDSTTGTTGLGFAKSGANKTITYSGDGLVYVNSDVQINASLVTTGANSFPTNVLGIVSNEDMNFNEANIDVMGLFYATDEISVQKQTDIIGTIVSNSFDMGTNVPAIYQVPETLNNLPTGMVNSNAFWYLVVAWIKT